MPELPPPAPGPPFPPDIRRPRRGRLDARPGRGGARHPAQQGARALPHEDLPALCEQFGIAITTGGVLVRSRQARALEPTYRALCEGVRASSVVAPDETGWRVDASKAWLWAFVGDGVTVYLIAAGRGYEQAVEVLGVDFSGTLERDGWAPYRRFTLADHQSCLAHCSAALPR
ncbi:MAG: IS66 family transposase [Gaiellaceae bacterium]